jgi:hypothetical protein
MRIRLTFSCSDSLQRHLITRHSDSSKQNQPKQSIRACVACHTSKIKCDGNEQCSRCLKKGIYCKYNKQDPKDPKENSLDETMGQIEGTSDVEAVENSTITVPDNRKRGVPDIIGKNPAIVFGGPPGNGPIDWSTVRIQKDTSSPDILPATSRQVADDFKNPFPQLESVEKNYLGLYFKYFIIVGRYFTVSLVIKRLPLLSYGPR